MDTAAKEFKSYSANLKMVDYTRLIKEKHETNGLIRFQKTKRGITGIVDMTAGPDPFFIRLDGPKGQKYFPKANEVLEGDLRKLAPTFDQILLLGFSVTREELQRDYGVMYAGADKVGSVAATRLVLSPKSAETLKLSKTIELWIVEGKSYPVQIKSTSPSGNYMLFVFSDLQLNPTLAPSTFELPAAAAGAKKTKAN